ncbi:hypothetical protein WDZ17_07450 [Pseudokineococcus basanitobsidens]|uniref:Uncharacterized protein n=1 Tax=Pseudokineococcus basanitobsidens TaxID=1926649 RepID=A0ABU8RJ68_9ACTN
MIVDCDGCAVRGPGCPDCVVSVLLGVPGEEVVPDAPRRVPSVGGFREEGAGLLEVPDGGLRDAERAAVGVLAAAGLVPPLRLVPVRTAPAGGGAAGSRGPGAAVPPAYDARRGATRAG